MSDADYTLTLNEYQKLALATMANDLTPEIDKATLGLGIAGESGEVADIVKKELGHGHTTDRLKLAKELGDVLWYVAVLANRYGFSLHEIGSLNIEKLRNRYPEGFESEKSINRVG